MKTEKYRLNRGCEVIKEYFGVNKQTKRTGDFFLQIKTFRNVSHVSVTFTTRIPLKPIVNTVLRLIIDF